MTPSTSSSSTPATEQSQSLGRIGFDAYGNHPGPYGKWTTFDGRPMPGWDELGSPALPESGNLTRERWEKAAEAIIAEHERRKAAHRSGKGRQLGEFAITIDASEAEATVARLEQRAASFLAILENASTLVDALDPAKVAVNNLTDSTGDGQVDAFLMGISEIASATRDLAEATRASAGVGGEIVEDLITDVTKALHDRVRALVSPSVDA